MTFGYLGYIWAMLCCALFAGVVGGSALFLYAIARRSRGAGGPTGHSVESLPLGSREPGSPPPSDAS